MLLLLLLATHATAYASQRSEPKKHDVTMATPPLFLPSDSKSRAKSRLPLHDLHNQTPPLLIPAIPNLRRRHEDYSTLIRRTNRKDRPRLPAVSRVRQDSPPERDYSPSERARRRVLSRLPFQHHDHFVSQLPEKRQRLDRSNLGSWTRRSGNAPDPVTAVKEASSPSRTHDDPPLSPLGSVPSWNQGMAANSPTPIPHINQAIRETSRGDNRFNTLPGPKQAQSTERSPLSIALSQERQPLPATPRTSGTAVTAETEKRAKSASSDSRESPQAQFRGPLSMNMPRLWTTSNTPSIKWRRIGVPAPIDDAERETAAPSTRQASPVSSKSNSPTRRPRPDRLSHNTLLRPDFGSHPAGNITPGPSTSGLDILADVARQHLLPQPQPRTEFRVPSPRFPSSVPQADKLNRLLDAAHASRMMRSWDKPPASSP